MTALTLNSLSRSLGLSPRGRAAHGTASPIVAAGLIAEWRFDDGAGQTLTDYSGNGHHGQLGSTSGGDSNDPTWVASPASLAFDGSSDYVLVPSFAGPDHWHLDILVKGLSTTQDYGMIYVAHGVDDNTALLQIFKNGSAATLTYRILDSGGHADYNGSIDLFDDGWHLVQVSRADGTMVAHVDGVEDVSGFVVGPPSTQTNIIELGGRNGSQFCGAISLAWAAWYSAAFDDIQRAQNEAYARALATLRGISLP
jgi:hypothetical protein